MARYIRRRRECPEEIEQLNREARAAAHRLLDTLPLISGIARGEPVTVRDERTGEEKVIGGYPRDQIKATRCSRYWGSARAPAQ